MSEAKKLSNGYYYQKQVLNKVKLIRFSHQQRFKKALDIFSRLSNSDTEALDYGCGDGTLLQALSNKHKAHLLHGADFNIEKIDHIQSQEINLMTIDQCKNSSKTYHLIFCLEVLEHCTEETQNEILSTLTSKLKSHGHIVISTPIEIGPPLIIKQVARFFASRIYETYNIENYTFYEYYKTLFATKNSKLNRPAHGKDLKSHGHKGYNWRKLLNKIQCTNELYVQEIDFSPFPLLKGLGNSQVWFLITKK